MDRDSSVGIATRYGMGGPGIECRWGRDFPHLPRPALGPTQFPIQWVPGLFTGVKRPGRGVDQPPLPIAEVKERVELCLYRGLTGAFSQQWSIPSPSTRRLGRQWGPPRLLPITYRGSFTAGKAGGARSWSVTCNQYCRLRKHDVVL